MRVLNASFLILSQNILISTINEKWLHIVVLMWMVLLIIEVEHFSWCLFSIMFLQMAFLCFDPFLLAIGFFFVLIYKNVLVYIKNFLLIYFMHKCFANSLLVCHLTLLMIFFYRLKYLVKCTCCLYFVSFLESAFCFQDLKRNSLFILVLNSSPSKIMIWGWG